MSKFLLASQRRLFSSLRIAKQNKRLTSASFFSTQAEETPPPLETFLNGTSSLYAEQMYEMYLEDPASVQDSWRLYFENEEKAIPFDSSDFSKPTSVPGKRSAAVAGVRYVALHYIAFSILQNCLAIFVADLFVYVYVYNIEYIREKNNCQLF